MSQATRLTTVVLALVALGLVGILSPALAQNVKIGVNIGAPVAPPPPPPVAVAPAPPPPPQPVVVVPPQPPVVIVPGAPVYFYGGQYFMFHGGSWFVSTQHQGPWAFVGVHQVPSAVRVVPGRARRGNVKIH